MKLLGIDLPTESHHIAKPIVLCALMISCFFLIDSSHFALYNPAHHGEYYRLLTSNLAHTNFNHLLMNCIGVILVWLFFADHLTWPRFIFVLLSCCIGSNLVAFTLAENDSLVGISGALHGMFIYGAMRDVIEKVNVETGWVILIGAIGKVILENTTEFDIGSANLIGTRVAVEAHLSGVVCGLILGVISWLWFKPLLSAKTSEKTADK